MIIGMSHISIMNELWKAEVDKAKTDMNLYLMFWRVVVCKESKHLYVLHMRIKMIQS